MTIKTLLAGGGLGLAMFTAPFGRADSAFDAPGNFNPLVPGYFADPTMEKFGDTYYLYATTDGNGGGRGPATVWVSQDFVNWTLVPMNWPTTPFYWAPDVVKRPDGRYYLYYNQPCNTYAGVSDSPIGPWTPLTPGDGLIIPDRLIKDVITLDTQVFEDKSGALYAYWGTWGIFPNSGCGVGKLNPDMKSFSKLSLIPNTQAKDFFEAPFMLERNGVYYFTYSSGSCHDETYRVQYAVGKSPDGEFTMGPNNPILASTPDGKVHGPGHHSVLREGDNYYIVYHRHDIPVTPNGMHRQVCADRLVFENDGVIKKVEPTHQGVGYLASKNGSVNLAFGKPVTASSYYPDPLRQHAYKPEYAVDNNNATLWKPGDNRMGHWLQVDLGSSQCVRRTQTQFEYGTWYYQYLIEYSLDGQTWQVFADRRQNHRWGSPMVDTADVEACYLRLTVTGVEYPGLFGAVWNFKAFADAPADPLLAMADQAFDKVVRDKPSSEPGNVKVRPFSAPTDSQPLIHLNAQDLQLGATMAAWTNQGTLGGSFDTTEAKPIVGIAAGCKAVRFAGKEFLTASFRAPRSLAGNSSFTVAAWVNNPEIGESECLVSWAGRGGPDGATAQIGYGTQRDFGAVGHWGFADMGFKGAPPKAGQWHHLAVVFDGVFERIYVDGQLNHVKAKMLMMHEGRPVYVGASEPGTEYYDGYLASLRIYDAAFSERQVQRLAAEKPDADVLVHLDSGKLDYGLLKSWGNHGALGGAFEAGAQAPRVRDVEGRIAASFETNQSLGIKLELPTRIEDFTLLVDLLNSATTPGACAVEIGDNDGLRTGLLAVPPVNAWHQVAVVYQGRRGTIFVDGHPTTQAAPPAPADIKFIRLGGGEKFAGAMSRLQLFRRALTATEVSRWHALWKQEWTLPAPNPAAFLQPPVALNSTTVGMTAQPGQSGLGAVEYRFTAVAGQPEASSSGWISTPFFLADGLEPDTRYAYTVAMRDAIGNVTTAAQPMEVVTDAQQFRDFTDPFAMPHDYLAAGVSGTGWSGVLGQADESAPEAIAARDGALRLQSKGTAWDGSKPRGAFIYQLVPGDFVAEVRVADYAGLAHHRTPGNTDGGLMVRVPRIEDAGPGEDLVQLNFFPIWNQGNMITSMDDGGRFQVGNQLAWEAHRYLQIIRQGVRFYFRTSADGRQWKNMPGSPVERKDMLGRPLQVGLYHASYGAESSYIAFNDFRLITMKSTPDTSREGAALKPRMLWADASRNGKPFSKDPSVIKFGGRYLLYYSMPPSTNQTLPEGWAIGIAESRELVNWTKVGELLPGQECDRKGLCAPDVILMGGKVHLFYQTYGNGAQDAICHAVSDDGLKFTRDASNPVFHPTGDWTSGRAIDAEVFPAGDLLMLYFATRDPTMKIQMIGVAGTGINSYFSRDTWKQLRAGPILKPELPWETRCLEAPTVCRRGDHLVMFYAGGYNNDPQQVGVAISQDGLAWTRLMNEPLLPNGQAGEWNSSESGHPGIFEDDDGRCYLFFQGNNDRGRTWFLSAVELGWQNERPFVMWYSAKFPSRRPVSVSKP